MLLHVRPRMTIGNRHSEKKFGGDSDARIEHRRICGAKSAEDALAADLRPRRLRPARRKAPPCHDAP